MSRTTNLALVSHGGGKNGDATALSQARQALAKRREELKDARATFEEANQQFMKVERLIVDKTPIENRIAELEKAHAALIAQWAKAGGDGTVPESPHVGEIERLKAELKRAETVNTGAKVALSQMHEALTASQQVSRDAIEAVRAAANDVLMERAAELAEELDLLEKRSALIRGHLVALQRHFQIEGYRRRTAGVYAPQVGRLIPRGPYELHGQAINAAVASWDSLADRLFDDPNAELQELKS
jgi:chromosome segregation ATPase